jgi:tetratricopeptide (TPR) repeat protein
MPQPAVLHIIGGNDRGKAYELVLPETRIGRGADQDLVLADIAVSRRHITIHSEGGRYRLQDLGSGNGTLLNGGRIDSVILSDGDQIELGNTLMRFDHQPSRQAGLSGLAAVGPPPPAPPPPYASSPPSHGGYTPAPMQSPYASGMAPNGETPSQVQAVSGLSSRPMPLMPHAVTSPLPAALAPLGLPGNRLIAFGVMGFLSLLSLIVIVTKTAFAKPVVVASDTEELYRQGLKLFASKDYEGAKISFTDALTSAPESSEVKRYITACDTEVHARGAMQAAERAATSHRYAEAVKALGAVDSDSLVHDDAVRRRKELAPKAAADDVEEARGLQTEDPDTAKARLIQALALDPGNSDARALAGKLHVDLPPLPANTVVTTPFPQSPVRVAPPAPVAPVVKEPSPPPVKQAVKPAKEAPAAKKGKLAAAAREDDDFAPVKAGKGGKEVAGRDKDAPLSPQGLAAYKTRDFAMAEKFFRAEARNQPAKQMEKTLAFANQVRDLKGAVDRATADEAKSPTAALKDYEDAIAIDSRVGKGMHAAYFRQRMGKLQLPLAQQAFVAGRYEAAFLAMQSAQRAGAGDGGLLKALDAKAKELTDKGVAVQKTQPAQAKTYWRQVIKMVPTSSPTYVRAYGLINASGGAHKDEDED